MKLDIMVPFWGKPEYLFETVDSVLAQDSDDWRLTIIDDCDPDHRVAAHFDGLSDPRVTYLRNETNLGIIANFQRCVDLATAEYVMIAGCDDRLLPNYVSTILRSAENNPGIEIIQPGVRTIGSDGELNSSLGDKVKALLRPRTPNGPRIIYGESACVTLLVGDWLYWPSLAFHTKTHQQTPFRDHEIVLDLALVIDLLRNDARILVEPIMCFEYRRHPESLSGMAKLLDGSRFADEREYFALATRQMSEKGWTKAAWSARLHVTSRLHAVTLIPVALKSRDSKAVKVLLRHVFGSGTDDLSAVSAS